MTQRRELNRAMAARHRGASMVRTLDRLGRNTPGMLELAGGLSVDGSASFDRL